MTFAETNNTLLENGIRPLRKRSLIYNYLTTKRNHPTVEKIYKDLLPQTPGLSKTTLYNVLNLFLEHNLVQALNIEGTELRYDADVSVHGHFKCQDCGQVYDFLMDADNFPQLPLEGFTSKQTHYFVVGECATCNKTALN